jgi:hypothetical protein
VPGKITQSIIKSMLGSFHDSINFDIKLNDNFRTDFPSISNLKCCPLSDSVWINCYSEEILVNMKIGDNGSLKTLHTIKFSVGNIAIYSYTFSCLPLWSITMTCLGPWTGYIGPFSLAPTMTLSKAT